MELRSPDPACNPYLAIGLVLAAGLDGIEKWTPKQCSLCAAGRSKTFNFRPFMIDLQSVQNFIMVG